MTNHISLLRIKKAKKEFREIPKLFEDNIKSFWARVDKNSDGECWEWTGAKNNSGSGIFYMYKRYYQAPRVAFSYLVGDIPYKAIIRQTCENKSCVNPDHLKIKRRYGMYRNKYDYINDHDVRDLEKLKTHGELLYTSKTTKGKNDIINTHRGKRLVRLNLANVLVCGGLEIGIKNITRKGLHVLSVVNDRKKKQEQLENGGW